MLETSNVDDRTIHELYLHPVGHIAPRSNYVPHVSSVPAKRPSQRRVRYVQL